ncbi:MAG: helix-turn-helix domain-containing protein [Candidatus Woesearchaeota archaeon]
MIVQKDFLNKLKDFGLNSYESKLWVALLSRGISTAGELSDISNVPRSRAYDVLESLEKKGFIIVKVGKPIKYLAVPPQEVVERVKKKVLEEAEQKTNVLEQLGESEILGDLDILHTQGVKMVDPTDKSGSFRSRKKIYEHLATMIKRAQKSITLVTTGKGLERKSEALYLALKKASQKGIKIRVTVTNDANKEHMAQFSKIADVKQSKSEARFCIVDNKELLLMLTEDKKIHHEYDCAVWIDAPYFVDYFNKLFDKEWGTLR